MTNLNGTHDPALTSWVESANAPETDFPIQNLPYGVYRKAGSGDPGRVGVPIGDQILDVTAAAAEMSGAARDAAELCNDETLNELMAAGNDAWSALRAGLSRLLREGGPADALQGALTAQADAEMLVPANIGDFSDFWASLNHATNAGKINRPDSPLLPNYKHLPIAYHARSSSFGVSGTAVRRPEGQLKPPSADSPVFRPCARLDYELELGLYIGPGNDIGSPIALDDAEKHLFGVCVLNDWSARDIQAWEYVPLGPFQGKNFANTISPWVVTMEALAPFRTPAYDRAADDPALMPYLASDANAANGGIDIRLEVLISSAKMRAAGTPPALIGASHFKDMYWTAAQMVTQHTASGCNLRPGDLLGSGTVSDEDSFGSLLETSWAGSKTFNLPSGEERTFLEDGDEVIMRGYCEADGARRIGLGECRAEVLPS